MSRQSLLHIDGKWLSFEGDRVATMDARPRVSQPTIVVTDFDGAVSDVTSLEGSPSHAMALIERRLRADGLLDGDSKVLIHRMRTVGNGYQALFTAVPLDRWQALFAWADGQEDHCLLVPLVGLLWKRLRPGHGVVLHCGRKVLFLAALRNTVVYASALAFSDSRDDLAMTVGALGDSAGVMLSADDGALEPLAIEWIGALTPLAKRGASTAKVRTSKPSSDHAVNREPASDDTPTERTGAAADSDDGTMSFDGQAEYTRSAPLPAASSGSIWVGPITVRNDEAARDASAAPLDETLLEIFAANCGAPVTLAPHEEVSDAEGRRYRSGAMLLLRSVTPAVAVNSGSARAMFLAERLLPWASAASLVLALGLGALGGRWALAAHEEEQRTDGLRAQVSALDEHVGALAQPQTMPTDFPAVAGFIGRATALSGQLDPAATLLVLREAAGTDVRILRLRLDTVVPDTPTLRIDGLVNYSGSQREGERGQQIARFVQRLRDAGYSPVAIDPQAGNAGGSAPGGLFSYQLTRAPIAPNTGIAP